jgi:hypothetical protein
MGAVMGPRTGAAATMGITAPQQCLNGLPLAQRHSSLRAESMSDTKENAKDHDAE